MKTGLRTTLIILGFGLLACSGPPPVDTTVPPPVPDAIERVQAMSDLLASAPALNIATREVHQWIDQEGEWARLEAACAIDLWRPDALHITVDGTGDIEIDHTLFYDGWVLTLESHSKKVFSRAEVKPTVDEMLDEVDWRFDLPIPAADMLYSSPFDSLISESTTGSFVAQETVGDRACDRFAFVGPTVDWEIWIEADDDPLPCRLDIVHKEMDGPPRSEVVFASVDLEPEMTEALFTFEPREDYREIPVVENPPADPIENEGAEEENEAADERNES